MLNSVCSVPAVPFFCVSAQRQASSRVGSHPGLLYTRGEYSTPPLETGTSDVPAVVYIRGRNELTTGLASCTHVSSARTLLETSTARGR